MISAMALTVHFRFAAPGRPCCAETQCVNECRVDGEQEVFGQGGWLHAASC